LLLSEIYAQQLLKLENGYCRCHGTNVKPRLCVFTHSVICAAPLTHLYCFKTKKQGDGKLEKP